MEPVRNAERGTPPGYPGLIRSLLGLFFRAPSQQLLSFDEVQRALKSRSESFRGTRLIPLSGIVGSVGRYREFTRAFMPRPLADKDRYQRVLHNLTQGRCEPIEVYQIGEVYFVRDGNHRVAAARALGREEIEARVVELATRTILRPDMDPDQVVGEAARSHFLENTNLDRSRPEVEVLLTCPDRYSTLLDHIEVHRYYLGQELQRDVALEEAAASWLDNVYLPVIEAIRATGALREFPRRTEADLYLWVAYHRECLKERYATAGSPASPSDHEVATALAQRFSDRPLVNLVKTVARAVRAAFQAATESPEPPERAA